MKDKKQHMNFLWNVKIKSEANMEQPNYYAIIPANVRYSENLSFLEKFLYAEITALSNLNGYCCAKNKYFANLYSKDEKTISRAFSNMVEQNVIHIEYEKVGAKVTKRKIYPLDIKKTSDKIVNGAEITSDKNITREQEKLLLTIDKIVTHNNSSYEDIIKLIIVSFNKDKKKSTQNDLILQYGFSEKVIKAIQVWLDYKREKGQSYKETGLKVLLSRLKKDMMQKGDDFVIKEIEYSISNLYSGIFAPNENKQYIKPKQQTALDIASDVDRLIKNVR